MKTINEQLRDWADKTADFYHNIAIRDSSCDLAFYTQSDLSRIHYSPELLILAINPGSSGSYKDQIKNPNWHLSERMSGEKLLAGNPWYGERESWHLWMRLRRIFSFGKIENYLNDEASLVYSNVVLFNTPKAAQIPAVVFEKYKCQERCMELIEILRPKRILCLGRTNCFKRLSVNWIVELIPAELHFGTIGKERIPVFGIPHTASYYSTEEMDMLGSCLGYLFACNDVAEVMPETIRDKFGDKIEAWKSPKANNPSSENWFDIHELAALFAANRFESGNECKNGKWFEFDLTEELLLRISSGSEGQYIGIRAKKRAKDSDYNAGLTRKEEYIQLLSNYGWAKATTWLGRKSLKKYNKSSDIIADLRKIGEMLAHR